MNKIMKEIKKLTLGQEFEIVDRSNNNLRYKGVKVPEGYVFYSVIEGKLENPFLVKKERTIDKVLNYAWVLFLGSTASFYTYLFYKVFTK